MRFYTGWVIFDRGIAVPVFPAQGAPRPHHMSKRRPPWFWNAALLERLTWLLLAAVFAAYAGRRALAHWGWPYGP
jgi:hypothetical protein